MLGKINLHDVTIIETTPAPTPTPYVINGGNAIVYEITPTPSSGIQYYIDTSPPGGGILYINDKESPTTGTLSPGSYTFSLEIGGQVYAFPTTSLSEGQPKVVIIVGKDKITCSICQ